MTVAWRLVFGTLYDNLGTPRLWLESLGLVTGVVLLLAAVDHYWLKR